MTRRSFVAGAAALALRPSFAAEPMRARLRVGIMSDVHCHSAEALRRFMRGLEVLRDARIEAVLLAGDLFTRGTIKYNFPNLMGLYAAVTAYDF